MSACAGMGEITVQYRPKVDIQSVDRSEISVDDLKHATIQHRIDMENAASVVAEMLKRQVSDHDISKLAQPKRYHKWFTDGYGTLPCEWSDEHLERSRHLLLGDSPHVPRDVNLIDVIECILNDQLEQVVFRGNTNGVDAISTKVLEYAFDNTVRLIQDHIKVVTADPEMLGDRASSEAMNQQEADDKPEVNPAQDAKHLLEEAIDAITGEKLDEYGTPEDNFGMIAAMWSAYLGKTVCAYDVAVCMALLKVCRLTKDERKRDSWMDAAGYVALGAQLAKATHRQEGD